MLGRTIIACYAAFAAIAAATPILPRAAAKPLDDPFYDQPANIASYSAGAIIRSRPTPGPLALISGLVALNIQGAYQLMFRTQDAIGNPTAAVTTVMIPQNATFDKLLSYQTAYDSSDPNCSPSYTLQLSSNETSYDPILLAGVLNQGWIVVTPDYEGLQAEFVAGLTSGYSMLDSIRATLASESITGVLSNATTAIWGYSGGALATEWALELQPLYAPDLKFVGAALGGLTPNVTNVLNDVNKQPFASLAFSGINGLAKAYPNLTTYLNGELIASKAAEFHSVNYACTNESDSDLAGQDIYTYFTSGDSALQAPVPASVIKWGATMGLRSTPTAPLYVYKAIADEVSPVADTDALVAEYCSRGVSIEYDRNTVGEHVTEALLGSGTALGFLMDRMNGIAAPATCSTKNVTIVDADVDSFEGFTQILIGLAKALLNQPLGPDSYLGI